MRRGRKYLSIVLMVLLSFSSVAFAAKKEGVVYTALGDSIAFGTGATDGIGYTELLNQHLTKIHGEGTFHLLASDGLNSAQMLTSLSEAETITKIMEANIITISIGGNDLLGPFLEDFEALIMDSYFDPVMGVDYDGLMMDLEDWRKNPDDHQYAHINNFFATLGMQEFPVAVQAFPVTWDQIIGQIRALNLEAEIYVNTVYNPFVNIPELESFIEPFIQGINTTIFNNDLMTMYDYHVVDAYGKFAEYGNPKKLAVGDLSNLAGFFLGVETLPVPLHPTDLGYKFIFNLHKDLM